ncbi:GvpL/GvpF family gas vesicle protein [Nostoc sp. DedQUE03]|uniref:GvpL/GvpF family gas vesicle protein n=1 Tax=Nostoc sp. DedQUE03 TaxID=3075389 RepID=UPI002AD29E84|nr:GvpL/GvpF family gas vesicle protein [Nostoc sp. DedQUE03]MDZ7976694.1 GvpL/GvpF family gas vesicle protein [Nostoc sp. DedQUE03]MDZ8044333.1 GvpL/GvpF family gas vesicle protein [Nostoc sp. DedQUE02]
MELYNLYVYAFIQTPVVDLNLPLGISNIVVLISKSGVSALVEPAISLESLQNNDESLIKAVLSHDRVIYEVFRHTTVLPLRFGTSFASQESLLNHLETHAEEYLEKLCQIKDKNQYILKFIPRTLDETNTPSASAGKEYLLAKKQRYQAQQNFYTAQITEWENIAQTITQIHESKIVQKEGKETRIYLLVSSQNESLLTAQLLAWQEACPRWELQLGEPLPPYDFI